MSEVRYERQRTSKRGWKKETPKQTLQNYMQIDDIERNFTYHAPKNAEQVKKYEDIRAFAKTFSIMLAQAVPNSSELDNAIQKIEEAVFWANAGIARHE